jgi:hypothetical protein
LITNYSAIAVLISYCSTECKIRIFIAKKDNFFFKSGNTKESGKIKWGAGAPRERLINIGHS